VAAMPSSATRILRVSTAAQTDMLNSMRCLARSGPRHGHLDGVAEAQPRPPQALDLYQRKGNLPGTRESLDYLARHTPTREGSTDGRTARSPRSHSTQSGKITSLSPSRLGGRPTDRDIRPSDPGKMEPSPTFYSVQEMPASGVLQVSGVAAAPPNKFERVFPSR